MADWFSLGSSAGSSSLDLLGGLLNYKYQKKLMDKQYKLQIKGLKESPTAMRTGLESAGYNPIMALGNTNAYASGGSAPSVSSSSLGSNAVNAYQQNKLNQAQIDNTNASTNNINADTENKKVQKGILMADEKIRQYEIDMKKFDRDTQAYRFASEMKEMWSRTKLNLENAMFVDYNATSNRIAANAQKLQAETSAKWTPVGTGAGIAAGIGAYLLGKVPYLKKKKVGF